MSHMNLRNRNIICSPDNIKQVMFRYTDIKNFPELVAYERIRSGYSRIIVNLKKSFSKNQIYIGFLETILKKKN